MSICEKLNNNNYEEIILKHREKREDALLKLNSLMKMSKYDNYYPNMDIVNSFKDYFILNEKDSACLCEFKFPQFKKLQTFAKGAVGEVYLIEINGKKFIMKGIPNIPITPPIFSAAFINDYDELHILYNTPIQYNLKMLSDNKQVILNIGSDSFVNQTFIHMIINNILKSEIKNYLYQYDAFYCQTNNETVGFNITNLANNGTLADFIRDPNNDINYDFVINMFEQILVPLSILKCDRYGFVHGDLKTNNIFVNYEDNKNIFMLADFDKSSIFWKGVRFYNNDYGLLGAPFIKKYSGVEVNRTSKEIMYYTFPSKLGYDIQYYVMNSPIPIFMSYDIYTMIISLFREPVIYNAVKKNIYDPNNTLYKLLSILFFEDDLQLFLKSIEENYKYYEDYTNPIKNYIEQNNLQNEYKNIYKNRNKKEGKHEDLKKLINEYIKVLDNNNKGIGNINVDLNNYKLKIDIDEIYKLFKIPYSPNKINMELNKEHKKDTHIYKVASYSSWFGSTYDICISDCIKNKCKVTGNNVYNC